MTAQDLFSLKTPCSKPKILNRNETNQTTSTTQKKKKVTKKLNKSNPIETSTIRGDRRVSPVVQIPVRWLSNYP